MKMKWHEKLTLAIVVVICCLPLITHIKQSKPAPSKNAELSTQSPIQTTQRVEINTVINTTTTIQSKKTISVSQNPTSPEYFDDVVFVGDSVSEGLRRYAAWEKDELDIDYFGKAQFLTAGNFGVHNAIVGNCLPVYKGQKIPLEDNIAQMDVKKVYILLGLNDVAIYDRETVIENYEEVINRILSKKPDLDIIIQSVTPITRHEESLGGAYQDLDRAHINALNEALKEMAEEKDYFFLDIGSVLKDSEGFLPDEFSFDGTCHMRPEALELWINYLQTHTLK